MKSSITHNEYLQILGLAAAAGQINRTLAQFVRAAQEIVGEDPSQSSGHIEDILYTADADQRFVDKRLAWLKITVEPPAPAKPPVATDYDFSDDERAAALAVVQAARAQGWPEAAKLADFERALEVTP